MEMDGSRRRSDAGARRAAGAGAERPEQPFDAAEGRGHRGIELGVDLADDLQPGGPRPRRLVHPAPDLDHALFAALREARQIHALRAVR